MSDGGMVLVLTSRLLCLILKIKHTYTHTLKKCALCNSIVDEIKIKCVEMRGKLTLIQSSNALTRHGKETQVFTVF